MTRVQWMVRDAYESHLGWAIRRHRLAVSFAFVAIVAGLAVLA